MRHVLRLVPALLTAACLVSGPAMASKAPVKHATAGKHAPVVQYTCVMHPEVVTTKPGKCPKCGMTLVRKSKASL